MNFYTSIDEIPIYNWNRILEKSEYNFVSKSGKIKDEYKAKEAFKVLYNEYIDTFGINSYLSDLIELQNEIVVLKIDIALGEKHKKAILELTEFKLKKKLEKKVASNEDATIHIEKFMGFAIDEHKTSVKKYYNYLKALENGR